MIDHELVYASVVRNLVCVCPIFLQGEQRRLYTPHWVKFFNIFNILCMYIDVFIMYMYFIIYKKYENRECHTSMWTCTLVRTTCNTHSSTNSKYFINACEQDNRIVFIIPPTLILWSYYNMNYFKELNNLFFNSFGIYIG